MRFIFDVRLFAGCIARSMRTLLFSILLLAGACVKPNGNEPTPPSPPPGPASPNDTIPVTGGGTVNQVKKNVLINIIPTDVFYPHYTLTYDSSRYLKMINTSYHVFWKNDTISHIINFDTFNGDIRAVSSIFLYNTSKQCYKILTKRRSSWTNGVASVEVTNPFFSDPNDGLYEQYDSLVYSPSGQLTEVWKFFLTMSKTLAFQYTNAQSAAPFSIQYFGVSQTGQPNALWFSIELTTNNIDQPIFNTLWYLPFLVPASSRPLFAPVTPQTTPGFFYVYMPLVKKCITYWKFKDYNTGIDEHGNNSAYFYNSDSTVFTGRCNPNDGGWPWFTYGFKKI